MGQKPRLTLLGIYPSFAHLVHEMVVNGPDARATIQAVADSSKLDHGTIRKWLYQRTRRPEFKDIAKFADAHALPVGEVWALADRDYQKWVTGVPVPRPDLSMIRRGPNPRPLGRRVLASLLVAATLGMVPHHSEAEKSTTGSLLSPESRDYVKSSQRKPQRWWSRFWTPQDWACRGFPDLTACAL